MLFISRVLYLIKSIYRSLFPIKPRISIHSFTGILIPKKQKKRVLVIVHENFLTSKGGVESYARNLFNEFKNDEQYEFFYLCRAKSKQKKIGEVWQDANNQSICYINLSDGNIFSLIDFRYDNIFEQFLTNLQPDIIHFQHFIHFSLSWFGIARHTLPKSKLILTLHEFLAICPNSGQMIKTKWQRNQLCYQSGISECHKCFPYIPKAVLKIRQNYVDTYFSLIDLFIAPSHFLLERYKDYGINPNKIIYSENGQKIFNPLPKVPSKSLRLLYLGQLNYFKGIKLLLNSMGRLSSSDIILSIYGSFQTSDFEKNIRMQLSKHSNVKYYGRYNVDNLDHIFSTHDLLVVPSIWWENSPMVIQESFIAQTPVLCSDIGGMKEKVNDGINGLTFKTGSEIDLTKKILFIYHNRDLLNQMSNNIGHVKSIQANCKELKTIYDQLMLH